MTSFRRALFFLTTLVATTTAASSSTNLRRNNEVQREDLQRRGHRFAEQAARRVSSTGTRRRTTSLLAHIDVAEGAYVDMELVGGDNDDDLPIIVIKAKALDSESKQALNRALLDAEPEKQRHDLAGLYTKLSGGQEAPENVKQVSKTLSAPSNNGHGQVDIIPVTGGDADVNDHDRNLISDDNGNGNGNSGNGQGSGNGNGDDNGCDSDELDDCACFSNLTGNLGTNEFYAEGMSSGLAPYRGGLFHTIYAKTLSGTSWTAIDVDYASEGEISVIQAWSTDGSKFLFKAETSYATGDGYHWIIC